LIWFCYVFFFLTVFHVPPRFYPFAVFFFLFFFRALDEPIPFDQNYSGSNRRLFLTPSSRSTGTMYPKPVFFPLPANPNLLPVSNPPLRFTSLNFRLFYGAAKACFPFLSPFLFSLVSPVFFGLEIPTRLTLVFVHLIWLEEQRSALAHHFFF